MDEEKVFTVKIDRDHSEFGHDIPDEFQILLDQDEDGNGYFLSLNPGKQGSLIFIVTRVKSS